MMINIVEGAPSPTDMQRVLSLGVSAEEIRQQQANMASIGALIPAADNQQLLKRWEQETVAPPANSTQVWYV